MYFHVNFQAAKRNSLTTEAKPLFDGVFAAKLDSPSRADNSLPGQAGGAMEGPDDLARGSGISGGGGDGSIGCNLAARHAENSLSYFVRHQAHEKQGRIRPGAGDRPQAQNGDAAEARRYEINRIPLQGDYAVSGSGGAK